MHSNVSYSVSCLETGVVAVVDSSRTGVPSLYHVNCEILIRQGTNRCDYCKKHRKSLSAMASHHHEREQTVVHTSILSLKVSIPIIAYINALASTVSNLQDKVKSYGDIPSGT